MDRDAAIALIRASELAPRAELIAEQLWSGARLRATRDASAGQALVSRFGGAPVLPRGAGWPTWDSTAYHQSGIEYCRRNIAQYNNEPVWAPEIAKHEEAIRANPTPLQFLGMLRLPEVAAYKDELALPADGALLFFYDVRTFASSFKPEARGSWRVIHAPESALELRTPPAGAETDFHPARLSFELLYNLPRDIRGATGEEDLCAFDNADYERLYIGLGGNDHRQPVHQLDAAPAEVQDDPFLECEQNDRETSADDGFWRLLLQVDTDEHGPGWSWGDSGRLYFCMREGDLRAGRFDRGWCVNQSS